MATKDERFEIVCPCCETRLMIDAASGAILSEERPKRGPTKTFDEAVDEVRSAKQKAEKDFAQRLEQTRNEKEILAKKFEEAMKRAEKNKDEPLPPRPFEFD